MSAVREIRVILCQAAKNSQGARDFVTKNFAKLSGSSKFPILVRECSGVEPRFLGRFSHGKEVTVPLSDLTSDQVLSKFNELAKHNA